MDDPRLRELGEILDHKSTFGFDASAHTEVHFTYSTVPGEPGFTLKDDHSDLTVHSSMFGHYNASNMLAAYTVGKHFQVAEKMIVDSLSHFVPGANRSEIITYHDSTIIKDAYNANPSSMELALRAFSIQYPHGWIVLGDMKELGIEGPSAHRMMLELVSGMPFDRIYLVGENFSQAYLASGLDDHRITTIPDIHRLKTLWKWEDCYHKAILLKGSRSMQLEQLLST
jgi:UDP-N-acetylmuramoyl-tripeptide--D-alanyl-D-alanine ligase